MSNDQPGDLMSVISEVFAPREVTLESAFEDLEATSVTLLRLMVSIQSTFDVDLDVVDMFTVANIGELVQLVEERIPASK
ncbi:acyl carrier protein [Streptomyces sp. NEAU-sy36]|uniref:acyl carrier protein n=1 Tax=unclassified Streptomyces TaxID=2593676 RepID=UPI0015D5903B|nr:MULTISPECIES: acyl carrier protein [unclassified Streptomyces]QLJ02793.1 acyl carrier protein [Streptomyces sp. NEAU-sy36]